MLTTYPIKEPAKKPADPENAVPGEAVYGEDLRLAQATTTQRGTVELADNAEALTGTSTTLGMTPSTTKYVLDKHLVTGPAHIIPVVTSNSATNGANFLAAYAAAAALTPGGAPLSATNRACVLLLPGTYDWTATALLFIPSDNVDIAGISGNRDDVQMVGDWAGGITCNYNASNVTGGIGAFHVDSTLTGVFRNCKGGDYSFAATDTGGGTFSGTAVDCVGGVGSFGGSGGTFSGTATGCTGGDYSFGSATFSGTATNCTGGEGSFGSSTFSGTATGCTGGADSFGGYSGTFFGTATGCTGGNNSFGGSYGTFSGTATGCTGGEGSFSGNFGTFSGTATGCTGGHSSFGGGGNFSGTATDCVGGDYSFGGYGNFSGTATNCTGGTYSFGGFGAFSGTVTITGCVGGISSLAGSFSSATSVLFKDCRLTTGSFADPGDTDVKIRRCINADLSEANFN